MFKYKLDDIEFTLTKPHDLSWLKKFGKAFWSVDTTGSGCLCVGIENDGKRYFCKIAGTDTTYAEVPPEQAIQILKDSVKVYTDLAHPNLIKFVGEYYHEELYMAVFEWYDGDCLFDHWNFWKYSQNPELISPKERFKALPVAKKLASVDAIFSFLQNVIDKGYIAVDLYDGSFIYDFDTDTTMICDIDFYTKAPLFNTDGEKWIGTERLKAPEEYELGAALDEQTNIFTLGALLFEFFGTYTEDEVKQRYVQKRVIPCPLENWQLGEQSYNVALKAVSPDKADRYNSLSEFYSEWTNAVSGLK